MAQSADLFDPFKASERPNHGNYYSDDEEIDFDTRRHHFINLVLYFALMYCIITIFTYIFGS